MRTSVAALALSLAVVCGCWELRPGTDDRPPLPPDEAAVDVPASDVRDDVAPDGPDASVDAEASVDADAGDDADAAVVVDAGPPTLRGTFVPGTVQGDAGGYVLRGVVTWHARVQGTMGGYTLDGWIR